MTLKWCQVYSWALQIHQKNAIFNPSFKSGTVLRTNRKMLFPSLYLHVSATNQKTLFLIFRLHLVGSQASLLIELFKSGARSSVFLIGQLCRYFICIRRNTTQELWIPLALYPWGHREPFHQSALTGHASLPPSTCTHSLRFLYVLSSSLLETSRTWKEAPTGSLQQYHDWIWWKCVEFIWWSSSKCQPSLTTLTHSPLYLKSPCRVPQ